MKQQEKTMNAASKPLVHTLGNGLRVAAAKTDGNVAYAGLLVKAGSRDDGPGRDGLAHFVEHTLFKGTRKRSNIQISNRMESVGGELNAYTTKEHVMLYTTIPTGYEDRSLDLLADLAQNASFPEEEVKLEKGVVLEEINSYADSPSYAVFDQFEELFYEGTALAHNILGYEDTVDKLKGTDARGFLVDYFTPDNMVAYIASPIDPQKAMQKAEKWLSPLSRRFGGQERVPVKETRCFDEKRSRDNRQANTVLGVPLFNATDPRRYAMFLLSNMLGGPAMNSVLNRELREKCGLVYTVETSLSLFDDIGAFQVYFGTDPENVEKCTRIVRQELQRLADKPLSDRSFGKATRQLCGQLLVSSDNRESTAMAMAKNIMRFGEIYDTRHTAEMISALTPVQLMEVAQLVATNPLSRLTLT